MKKNKKILSEQSNRQCDVWTNPKLKLMCESGCFQVGTVPDILDKQQVAKVQSKMYPGYYAVYFGDYDQKLGGCTIKYYSGETFNTPLNREGTNEPLVRRGNCGNMNETLGASVGPDIDKALASIKKYTGGQVVSYETVSNNPDLISQGWELIPITQSPGYDTWKSIIESQLGDRTSKVMVWKKSGAKQYQGQQSNECIEKYKKLGYVETQKPTSSVPGVDYKNLQTIPGCSEYFATEYWMKLDLTNLSDPKIVTALSSEYQNLRTAGLTKSACKTFINLYVSAYNKKASIEQESLNSYKPIIRECDNQFRFVFLEKSLKNLEYARTVKSSTGTMLDYSLSTNRTTNENFNISIKNTIKENLIKIKENKTKVINEDTKIVIKRFNFLTENAKIRTEKEKKEFFNKVILEMYYLSEQGVNKKVINEQLLDMLKSLFSQAPETIQQIFLEHFADFIIGIVSPNNKDHFIAKFISTSIGNMPITDITKLTDCGFLTNYLSKSLVETLVRQGADKKLGSNLFYDSLRNAVVEALDESNLGQKIQGIFADFICTSLPNIKNKMAKASENIKKAAIDNMGGKKVATA